MQSKGQRNINFIVKQHIKKNKLIVPGDQVMVGVSGGPDSMALLHWLKESALHSSFTIMALHLNHSFRGREADEDQEYVQEMSKHWGIPCQVKKVDVAAYMKEKGVSKQVAARECRYAFFREVAQKYAMNKLALAHHGDDQAETIIMRMIRGAGLAGLSGMPVKRQDEGFEVIRPFLSLSKLEIEAYCRDQQIYPREDLSNLSDDYTRNKIRHHILPYIQQENPNIHQVIYDMSDVLRAEDNYLDALALAEIDKILVNRDKHKLSISLENFSKISLPLQRRIVLLILSYLPTQRKNWSRVHIEQIIQLCQGEHGYKVLHLPDQISVKKEYNMVTFLQGKHNFEQEIKMDNQLREKLPSQGEYRSPHFQRSIHVTTREIKGDNNKLFGDSKAYVGDLDDKEFHRTIYDAEKLSFPLEIRGRRQGDQMQPLGMKGHRKVKNIFIDLKVPLEQRDNWPMVLDQEGIIWIPGLKRSNRALITQETKKIVMLEIEKNGEETTDEE